MSVAISDMQAVSFTAFWKARLSVHMGKKNPTMTLACSKERAGWQTHSPIPLGYVSTLHNGFQKPNKLAFTNFLYE